MRTPKQIAMEFGQSGVNKTRLSFLQFALLAILGGCYIAFGGLLTVVVAGGMPESAANPGLIKFIAGALFPIGLILVVIAGADLFTSDCAGMSLAYLRKEVSIKAVLKIWLLSYFFNLIGTQLIAFFMSSQIGLINVDPWKSYLHKLAENKVHHDFYTVFLKGIGANFLVCLGAWMGYAARDTLGKAIGIWIPVMLFVTLGYEHSIANLFFIPAAIYTEANIQWSEFFIHNLLPATLGNIVGGVLLAYVYWQIYLKKSDFENLS